MFRRLLGLIILLVSLITAVLLLGGAYFSGQAVDSVGAAVDNTLALTVETLDTVSATLEQTKSTIVTANDSVATAVQLTENLSKTVSDTQPLMESMTSVVSQDVPDNIEAIQTAIPNVAGVAGVVDKAMTTLSNFGIEQTIPIPFNPITLEFDLGIDYEPEEPFDETILSLGDSLEGMPDKLRSLQSDLEVLSTDLELVSSDILATSGDLAAINEQVALFIPLLDDYLRIVGQITDTLARTQAQLAAQLETVKIALMVTLIFLALTQLAPLYLGWELLTGRRGDSKPEEPAREEPEPPAVQEKDLTLSKEDEITTSRGLAGTAEPQPQAAAAEEIPPEMLEPAPEDLYDPATETMIEAPGTDPTATIVEDTPPASSDDQV